jgi:hypothetical protein
VPGGAFRQRIVGGTTVRERRRRLLLALLALAFAQLGHLLDVLRYARGAEFPSVLIDPAALFGIAAALVVFFAVLNQEPFARGLAIAAGASVAIGFTLYHGIPVRIGRNNPYWGPDGHADVIRWLTVLTAIVIALYVVRLAYGMPLSQRRSRGAVHRRRAVADFDHPQRSLRLAPRQFPPRSGR